MCVYIMDSEQVTCWENFKSILYHEKPGHRPRTARAQSESCDLAWLPGPHTVFVNWLIYTKLESHIREGA